MMRKLFECPWATILLVGIPTGNGRGAPSSRLNSRLYPAGSPAVILLTCGGTRNMPREPPPPPPNAAPPHRPAPKGRVLHQPPAHRTAPRRSPRSPEEPWVDYWATSTWPNWQPFRPNAPAQVRTKATHPFSVLAVACICLLMFQMLFLFAGAI